MKHEMEDEMDSRVIYGLYGSFQKKGDPNMVLETTIWEFCTDTYGYYILRICRGLPLRRGSKFSKV